MSTINSNNSLLQNSSTDFCKFNVISIGKFESSGLTMGVILGSRWNILVPVGGRGCVKIKEAEPALINVYQLSWNERIKNIHFFGIPISILHPIN